jgi:Na+/H+ antiporter NhaD/arsenite permease-like protein
MNYLHNHAGDPAFKRFLDAPGKFYYASGTLSSVLDNAPTYVTFLETGLGKIDERPALAHVTTDREATELSTMLDDSGKRTDDGGNPWWKYLAAISMGAVFFGACTYIGNGPNFMVKSIAQHAGVDTPGFFNYILCYTLPILLPILILCWFLFLR